jgi:hypothetical protein
MGFRQDSDTTNPRGCTRDVAIAPWDQIDMGGMKEAIGSGLSNLSQLPYSTAAKVHSNWDEFLSSRFEQVDLLGLPKIFFFDLVTSV